MEESKRHTITCMALIDDHSCRSNKRFSHGRAITDLLHGTDPTATPAPILVLLRHLRNRELTFFQRVFSDPIERKNNSIT